MPRRRIVNVKVYYMTEWQGHYVSKLTHDALVLVPLPTTQDSFRMRCGYHGIKIRNGCKDKEARITIYQDDLPKAKPPFNPQQGQMGLIENGMQFKLPALNRLIKEINNAIEAAHRRRWQMAIALLVFVAACVFSICFFMALTPSWLNDAFHVGGAFAWVALAAQLTGWFYDQLTDEMSFLGQLCKNASEYCQCKCCCRSRGTGLEVKAPPGPVKSGTVKMNYAVV